MDKPKNIKPDIIIIAQYLGNIECPKSANSRFCYIADMLSDFANVEIITTDFYHAKKRHFKSITTYNNCKVTMLHEPGYPKNVCLRRFKSHWILAKNLKKYLVKRARPDLIYVAVPSLDVAETASNYCLKYNVPLVIDIQDVWPEAFKMAVDIPLVTDIVYWPMERQANHIYSSATEIVAVSQTYLQRGQSVNNKARGAVVYLGTDQQDFDHYAKGVYKGLESNKIKLIYVGTLGHSYDLHLVFKALRKLDNELLSLLTLKVIGDGPKKKEFEQDANGLPIEFYGRLNYGDMVKELVQCDIAINPIIAGSPASIINKHMDYAMAGLPVINTQESPEYRYLIDKWRSGINCRCGNAEDLAKAIEFLALNKKERIEMGLNSRKMGEKLFDRRKTYLIIPEIIKQILGC